MKAIAEIEKYKTMWKRRLGEDEEARLRLRKEAIEAAGRAAKALVERFGAEKVYLFGSVLEPRYFTEWSDIDMVVLDLAPAQYFKALSGIWGLLPHGMELDLIPYEDADSFLKEKVLREGVLLYDKKQLCRY